MMRAGLTLLFSVWATVAQTDCASDADTVLSCTARGGTRALDVCITGDSINYAFGPPGAAPELTLSETVADVQHQPWPGIGRAIWEATTFTNDGYAYEVYISVDRLDEDHPTSSGVNILKGEDLVAQVECDPGSDTIGLWAVADAKEAHGICWDTGARIWGECQ